MSVEYSKQADAGTEPILRSGALSEHFEEAALQPQVVRDWSEDEVRALRKKLDFTVIPKLMIGLFALQLDKGSIAYAAITTFAEDLGITNDIMSYGNQLMQAGIVIWEVPFNMVLSHIGPAKWLVIQIFVWGTISTAQTALSNQAGFYATRFSLGMWEAGYTAAALTILSWYYPRKEMAMRVTLVYLGNYFSSGVGGLLAAAIFKIPESTGLKRWQVNHHSLGFGNLESIEVISTNGVDAIHGEGNKAFVENQL